MTQIDTKHPEWQRNVARWHMALDFYNGGIDVMSPRHFTQELQFVRLTDSDGDDTHAIEPTPEATKTKFRWVGKRANSYLFGHDRERDRHWTARAARAVHIPVLQPIFDTYTSGVMRLPITRGDSSELDRLGSPWSDLLVDVTATGDNMNVMTERQMIVAMLCGRSHAIVVRDRDIEKYPSMMHAMSAGATSYAVPVTPVEMINWSLTPRGNFRWAIFQERLPDGRMPGDDIDTSAFQYRVIDDTYVSIWRPGRNKKLVVDERYEHGFTYPPIADYFYKRTAHTRDLLEAVPFAASLLDIDRSIFNKMSLLDQIDYNQTFSIFAVPGGSGMTALDLSVFEAIEYDASRGTPLYVAPNAAIAAGLWTRIKEQFQIARTVASVTRGMAEVSKEARSGTAMSFESSEKYARMTRLASSGQEYENGLLSILADAQDVEPIQSRFPKQFDVLDLNAKIDHILSLKEAAIPFDAVKPMLRMAARDVLVRMGAPSEEIKKSEDAIASATGPELPVFSVREEDDQRETSPGVDSSPKK